MPDPKQHTLNLDRGAVHLVKQVLASLGWYTETSDAYRAGRILEDNPAFEIGELPKEDASAGAVTAWASAPVHVIVTEKQRETMKRCVEHYMKKGGLKPSIHTCRLLDALGLAPED